MSEYDSTELKMLTNNSWAVLTGGVAPSCPPGLVPDSAPVFQETEMPLLLPGT